MKLKMFLPYDPVTPFPEYIYSIQVNIYKYIPENRFPDIYQKNSYAGSLEGRHKIFFGILFHCYNGGLGPTETLLAHRQVKYNK